MAPHNPATSPNVHDGDLADLQLYSYMPQSMFVNVSEPELGDSGRLYPPTSLINPVVPRNNNSSSLPTSSTSRFGTTTLQFDHLDPRKFVGVTEPGGQSEPNSSFAYPASRPPLGGLNDLSLASPTFYPDAIGLPSQQRSQNTLDWQNTGVSASWAHHASDPIRRMGNDAGSFLPHNTSQLLVDYLKPMNSYYYDSNGFSDKEIQNTRVVKKETLRKRRNVAMEEHDTGRRQARVRLTSRLPGQKESEMADSLRNRDSSDKDYTGDRRPLSIDPGYAQPKGSSHKLLTSPTSPLGNTTLLHSDPDESLLNQDSRSDDEEPEDTLLSPPTDNTNTKARLKHNKVERKYRHRLNNHFEKLLDVLPPPTTSSTTSHHTRTKSRTSNNNETDKVVVPPSPTTTTRAQQKAERRDRKVSKSEVLDRARMYIQTLESEHERLAAERKELLRRWDEYYGRRGQGGPSGSGG